MLFPQSIWSQLKQLIPSLIQVYLLPLLILTIIGIISYQADIPVKKFTQDPVVTNGGHPMTGFLSNLGVIIWSATVAICFFTYFVLSKRKKKSAFTSFFLFAGIVTTVLLLDDLFLIHERWFPVLLGLPEEVVYAAYIGTILGFLFFFRKVIFFKTDFLLIYLACGLFALSIGTDVFFVQSGFVYLFEDGTKFLGIVTWCFYFFYHAFKNLANPPVMA